MKGKSETKIKKMNLDGILVKELSFKYADTQSKHEQ